MQQFSNHGIKRRWRRGQGLLEAALVLPILLSLSLGLVEFGQFFYAKHIIQGAAREVARTAILPTATNSTVTTVLSNCMSNAGFQNSGYSYTIVNSTTNATVTDVSTVAAATGMKVTVSVNYGSVGVRPLGIIPANKQIVGITTMLKE